VAPAVKNIDDYAVVVGIDEYPDYRSLRGAVKDAQDFVKWLCEEEFGGGVPPANCKTVFSVRQPLSPLQDQIDVAFDSVFSAIPLGTQARRLYIYFSGHGMAESNLITDLCLASWAKKFPNRALDAQQYLDIMMKLGKFREIIMFLDCCRVRIISAKGFFPGFNAAAPGKDAPKARYFLANATEFLNPSYEAATTDDASAADPVIRGYFTRALMTALRGAAATSKGGVTASNLKNYLEENVTRLAKADNWDQDSEVVNGLKGDPVFGSAPPSGGPPPGPPPTIPPSPPGGPKVPRGPAPSGGPRPRGAANNLPLTLRDDLGAQYLTLLDAGDKMIFHGRVTPTRKFKLRPGSYTLRTHFHHTMLETAITLDGPLTISTNEQLPSARELYSAAPLEKSPTSHEYYTEPSQRWSREFTRTPVPNEECSLFIFIRAVDIKRHGANIDLAKGLLLLDRDGKSISDFAPSDTKRDNRSGWLGLHIPAPTGTYFLQFKGHTGEARVLPARDLPIQLCSGWQTQLFLMHRGAPLLQTTKIFFAHKGSGFRPQDHETEAADVALNGLQNNRDLLTESALNLLLNGKFENPMLGLVGAHVLIQRQRALRARFSSGDRKATSEEARQRDQLQKRIAVVLRNLNRLLPGSPDVAALNLLAGTPSVRSKVMVDEPPMLRLGLRALMKEAGSRPEVLEPESSIPAIAPLIYADTPWSTWAPIAEKREMNWVHFALLDSMKKSRDAGQIGTTNDKPLETLAVQLGIPQQTVRQAAKDFATTPAAKLWKSLPEEYRNLFQDSRSKAGGDAATLSASDFVVRTADLYEKA